MTPRVSKSYPHLNYFRALEADLEDTSRYVEFAEANFKSFSIEFAHLLLASASEVDVVAKQICSLLDQGFSGSNIDAYRKVINAHLPHIVDIDVEVPRFAITLKPWVQWKQDTNPVWWKSYNQVKHQRDQYFARANLQNAMNSVAGLAVLVFYLYQLQFNAEEAIPLSRIAVTSRLGWEPGFMQLLGDYYAIPLAAAG